jgi:hypothetical protein
VGRRRFNHLVIEISVAARARIPRYPLWLRLHQLGWDPEGLSQEAALAFCGEPLDAFPADHGLRSSRRARRQLRRAVEHYDPSLPTPYERMEALQRGGSAPAP